MEKTRWIYKKTEYDNKYGSINVDHDILSILAGRGIKSQEDINLFLNPKLDDISDPFGLKDVDIAVDLILDYIEAKKKICIYGDYDVDGVTSTSLLTLIFRNIGYEVEYYIPLRDEGYGLNKNAIKEIRDNGVELLITVDCGISSISEVEYAKELGLSVIVTDHHEITNHLPPADAVINPKREDNIYKFKNLAGVGTAFMLALALYKKLDREEEIYSFLDIVAVGTVADIVPLTNENRIFVKFGLKQLQKTDNIGFKELLKQIFDAPKEYDTNDIGFKIAPVFNAAGRLDDAKKAVQLITAESNAEARNISRYLIEKNIERKQLDSSIFESVEKQVSHKKLSERSVIIAHAPNFHHGVIGIVASRITDKYYKPSIILEDKENGTSVASARSIEDYNIIKALDSMNELFVKYGGHEGAAGFTIETDKIDELYDRLDKYSENNIDESVYTKPVHIDRDIFYHKIDYDFYYKVKMLEPFGAGNPHPLFSVKGVNIVNIKKIGKDKSHIMFDVVKDNMTIKSCVWFGKGHNFSSLSKNIVFDIAFKLDVSFFRGKKYLKIFVDDVKESKQAKKRGLEYYKDLYYTAYPISTLVYTRIHPENDTSLDMDFDSNYQTYPVKSGGKIIGFLDEFATLKLKKLTEYFNFKFTAKIVEVEETSETYIVKLDICRDYSFVTREFKDSFIFRDIKSTLLKDFSYNNMQKSVLSGLFKNNKSCVLTTPSFATGIDVLMLTAGMYFFTTTKKKSLIVSEEYHPTDFLEQYFDFESEYVDGYEFYVFINKIPDKKTDKKVLVITDKNIKLDGYDICSFNTKPADNISFIQEEKITEYEDSGDPVFTKCLPIKKKLEILKNLDKYTNIYATEDILALK